MRWLIAAALVSAGCGDVATRADSLRRELAGASVVVVAVDSLAALHTTPWGHARDTTPYLARLAARGVRFTDTNAASPSAIASLASLLSGEAVDVHRVRMPGQRIPDDVAAAPEAFRALGYRTLGISTHPGAVADAGFGRGFDTFRTVERGDAGRAPDAVHDFVASALDGERPFLALVHLTLLTPPRRADAEAADDLLGYLPDPELGRPETLAAQGRRRDEGTVLALVDHYDAGVRALDAELARIGELVERNDRGDTILVVVGTCGQAFGQHGRYGAGSDVHQEQLAVPLVLALPDDFMAGTALADPVGVHELLVTLVDLLGGETPSRTATPWTPLLTGDWLERRAPLVARTARGKPQHAIRRDFFKLIVKPSSKALYHLDKDPLEQTSSKTQRPELLRELDRELERFKKRYADRPAPERFALAPERRAALTAMGYAAGELGGE